MDDDPVLYTNRASCFKQLHQWDEMIADAKEAIRLDKENVKGLFYAGEGLFQLSLSNKLTSNKDIHTNLEQSLAYLKSAQRIDSIKNNSNFKETIEDTIRKLRDHILTLDTTAAPTLPQSLTYLQSKIDPTLFTSLNNMIGILSPHLVRKAKKDEFPPDYLSCPITLDLYQEPYTVSSGQTYEKSAILSHFSANGNTDPLTRVKLTDACLVNNKAIKAASEQWRIAHPL